jgi:hypothetical protein
MTGPTPERGSEEWEQQRASVERGSEAWDELHGAASSGGRRWYGRKRFIIPAGAFALLFYAVINAPDNADTTSEAGWDQSVSSAGLDTADQSMSFEECNQRIRSLADELGITPSTVVDSSAMRTVRFNTADGSVLVTCDAIDEKMIVVKSPRGG